MDWTPTCITTYLDEEVIGSFRIDAEACTAGSEFQRPHFLLLNLAVGGNYTGRLAPGAITAPLPAEPRIDYVRILDNGFTELRGASVSTGSKARDSRRLVAPNARLSGAQYRRVCGSLLNRRR